jgi:hypothetical protein
VSDRGDRGASVSRDRDAIDGAELRRQFGSQLLTVESPLQACVVDSAGAACAAALANLRSPYFIEDEPGAYHTTGWHGAYEA